MPSIPVLLLRPAARAAAVPAPLVKSHPAIYRGPVSRAQAEAGNYPKRRIAWQGLELVVENEAGSEREFPGGSTRIVFPYGEVRATEGVDGDPVDVIIGPSLETAAYVYVVHQRRAGRWSEYDEDKCMLGFMSEEEAQHAFLANYDDPRFLGPISILPVGEFVVKVRATVDAPAMIKSWLAGDDVLDLLKATVKKTIQVPGYYKADGTFVAPHTKAVHYNPDHQFHDIAHGGVSHSQKQAWKELTGFQWFKDLPVEDKAAHVMSLATDKQDAASAAAAVSGWKATATAGKNPTASQWSAFNALPKEKQAALYDQVGQAAKTLEHLKPIASPASTKIDAPKEAPAQPRDLSEKNKDANNIAALKKDADESYANGEQTGLGVLAEEATHGYPEVAAHAKSLLDNLQAVDKLEALEKSGSHYQKEALKKLKADPAWDTTWAPAQKLQKVMDLYKQLQGAASQSAAVSLWKKALLAGKYPSAAQTAAFQALQQQDHAKAIALAQQIVNAIGSDKYAELIGVTSAPLAAPSPSAAAAPIATHSGMPPAFDVPAYDYVGINTGSNHSPKELAEHWDAENPGNGAQLSEALVSLGYADLAAAMDLPAPDDGSDDADAFAPKDGDTKDGANGTTLVFKNGRWHTQAAASVKTAEEYQDIGGKAGGVSPQGTSVKNAAMHAAAGNVAGVKSVLSQIHGSKPKTKAAVQAILDAVEKDHGGAPAAQAGEVATPAKAPRVVSVTPGLPSGWTHNVATNGVSSPKSPAGYSWSLYGPKAAHGTFALNMVTPGGDVIENYSFQSAAEAIAYLKANAPQAQPLPTATWVNANLGFSKSAPAPATAKLPDPVKTVTAVKTTLHNTTDGHNKSWSVYVSPSATGGYEMVTQYGPIGKTQQKTVKQFITQDGAFAAAAKLKNEKLGNGYKVFDTDHGHKVAIASPQTGASEPEGPKDGDTKPAADGGTLVFKDGRWHKKTNPDAVLSQEDIDAAMVAKFGVVQPPNNIHLKSVFKAVLSGDVAAAESAAANIKHGAPKSKATALALIQQLKDAKAGKATTGNMTMTPVKAPAASTPKATPEPSTAAPAAAAAPVKPAGTPPASVKPGQAQPMDSWKKVGAQQGSNAGGYFEDGHGTKWYCKFPGSEDIARNEVLAAKFYQMLGAKVPFVKLVRKDGKLGIASRVIDGLQKKDAAGIAKASGAREGFIFDAWLGNWDVIGMSNDNLLVDKEGVAVRVDPGGSLVYRAQGGKKTDFGDTVPELESMLDPKKNAKAAAVFKGTSKAAFDAGVAKMNMLKPSQITELVQMIGPGSAAEKVQLAQTLIARRAFILKKFGVADQWSTAKKLDPTKLPVNVKDLPKPIDFAGKSSKAWVNEKNSADSQALVAFAAQGNLVALKEYQFDSVDKETGAPTGKKSIIEHPSKHIQEQWAELVQLLQSIEAPSLPTLDMPSLGAVGSLEEISSFVGSFQPVDRPETVATEHRLGFFMALNQIDDIHDLVKDMKWSFIQKGGPWVSKMKNAYSGLSALVRKYISSVQASGSINHVWSQGKGEAAGVGLNKLAAEIYKQAVDIPEGTVLRRGMSDTTAGKMMTKQLLNAKPGLVIQNTDSMCTSFNESHSWGGDIQMTIRCVKGAKATPSFASGSYSSEYEITTLPGQRYVVLSVEKKGTSVHVDCLMLPPHEGFVTELKSLAAMGKALQSVLLFIRKVV